MELHYYLEPSSKNRHNRVGFPDAEALGQRVDFFDGTENWFDNHEFDIAIIGVPEFRGVVGHTGANVPGEIRYWLYGLRNITASHRIADLGNVRGETLNDRYQALEDVVEYLNAKRILVFVLGGSQDLTVPLSRGLKEGPDDIFDIAIADALLDVDPCDQDFSADAFIHKLGEEQTRTLDKVTVMGVQYYFLSPRQEDYMARRHFPVFRLRDIKGDHIDRTEPVLRDASLFSFDFGAMEASVGQHRKMNPFGLSGTEACRMFWYAGASDRMQAIGLFNVPASEEANFQVSVGALLIWHALEGISARCGDFPRRVIEDYQYRVVYIDDYDKNLRFFHNPENNRWWLEVPRGEGSKIIACHESDYENALMKEIPDIWWSCFFKSRDNQETGRIND
ncbi:MAG: arginase family protein [Marinilabiliaceae bacterium]